MMGGSFRNPAPPPACVNSARRARHRPTSGGWSDWADFPALKSKVSVTPEAPSCHADPGGGRGTAGGLDGGEIACVAQESACKARVCTEKVLEETRVARC